MTEDSERQKELARRLELEVEKNFPIQYACVNGRNNAVKFERGERR